MLRCVKSRPTLNWAAGLVAIHGGVEVAAGCAALVAPAPSKVTIFAFEPLMQHFALVGSIGLILGALRLVAAAAILRNRLWGWALGLVLCVVTLNLMLFMIPSGVGDGILSGTAIILLLVARYGDRPTTQT